MSSHVRFDTSDTTRDRTLKPQKNVSAHQETKQQKGNQDGGSTTLVLTNK